VVLEDRPHGIVYWNVDRAADCGEYRTENSKHKQRSGTQTFKLLQSKV